MPTLSIAQAQKCKCKYNRPSQVKEAESQSHSQGGQQPEQHARQDRQMLRYWLVGRRSVVPVTMLEASKPGQG